MGDKRENRIKSWEDTLNGSVRELEKTHILARGRGGHQLRNIFRDFPKKKIFSKKKIFPKKKQKKTYILASPPRSRLKNATWGFGVKKVAILGGGEFAVMFCENTFELETKIQLSILFVLMQIILKFLKFFQYLLIYKKKYSFPPK